MDESKQGKKVFNRNAFLNLPEAKIQEYFCESLGALVYLKEISALDYENYTRSLLELKSDDKGNSFFIHKPEGMRLKFLVRCLCDASGSRLFKDDEYELLGSKLLGKNNKVVQELYEKAKEINGGEEEGLEKNLKTDPEGGFNSG